MSWCKLTPRPSQLFDVKRQILSRWVSPSAALNHQGFDCCFKITLTPFWMLWTSSHSDHKMGRKLAFNFEEDTILSWVTSQRLLCKGQNIKLCFDGKCQIQTNPDHEGRKRLISSPWQWRNLVRLPSGFCQVCCTPTALSGELKYPFNPSCSRRVHLSWL